MLVLFIAGIYQRNQRTTQNENRPAVVTVLLKFEEGLFSPNTCFHDAKDISSPSVRRIFKRYRVKSMEAVFKNRYSETGRLKKELSKSNSYFLEGWQKIGFDSKEVAENFITTIRKQPGVEHVLFDEPFRFTPDIAPNDPEYQNNNQWHLNDPFHPNADIDAEAAWDINTGRNDVVIAILDGGVDYTHPDLDPGDRSRVIAGTDTGDDDNDPMDNLPYNDPNSFAGHGTSIAGVVGAITNNGEQVAGVMWNCRIMPVKMIRSGGIRIPHILDWNWSTSAFPSDVADAIDYAVNNGAHVINMSYSFPDKGWPVNEVALRIPLLIQAIDNAYRNNVVITASMGNSFETNNSTRYPAGFSEQIIAVGSSTQQRIKAASSNTGSHISVVAPGVDIRTTERGGGLRTVSGTSFSAPLTAGVAGLVISQGKDRQFNLTNDDVRHILELTAVDIYSVGFDNESGNGIVNAGNALQLLDEPNEVFHYNNIGGTSVKIKTIDKWELLSNRWGLAAGLYVNVNQYKITKHINFDVPFCEPPQVWMRERQSKCLSAANPNNGRLYSRITNVSNTGFDLEYYTYYVRKNLLDQDINKWIPAAPASTNVAYTVVGEPNFAGVAGLSGPSFVCSNSAYTVTNLPPGATITWDQSFGISRVSPQGSNPCTFSPRFMGEGWIEATINGGCGGSYTLPWKNVWIGQPNTPTEIIPFWNNGMEFGSDSYYDFRVTTQPGASYYTWNVGGGTIIAGQGTDWITVRTFDATGGNNINFSVGLQVGNSCGLSNYFARTGWVIAGTGGATLFFTPNPVNGETTLTIESTSKEKTFDETTRWDLEVYSHTQLLKTRQTGLLGKSAKIQTNGWEEGVYVVRVNYNGKILIGKLVVMNQ